MAIGDKLPVVMATEKAIANGVATLDENGKLLESQLPEIDLSNKQDKLTGQAGQVVGFNAQGAAQAVRGWSNPNLLDNWYFVDPVNQRGKTSYSVRDYIIDRWILGFNPDAPASFTLHPGEYSEWSGQGSQLIHRFPDIALTGKVVTVSVLLYDGTLLSGSAIYNYVNDGSVVSHYFNIPGVMEAYAQSDETEGLWRVVLVNHSTTSLKPVAVKFELGSTQTLARQDADGGWVLNDPPPNKALETAKCQRYQYATSSYYGAGEVDGEGINIGVNFPCTMRSTPTMQTKTGIKAQMAGYGGNGFYENLTASFRWGSSTSCSILINVPDTTKFVMEHPVTARIDTPLLFDANL